MIFVNDRVAAVEGAVIRLYSGREGFYVCPILINSPSASVSSYGHSSSVYHACDHLIYIMYRVWKLICGVLVVLCVRWAVLLCEVGGSVLMMMSVLRVQLDWITDWPLDLICQITAGAAFQCEVKLFLPFSSLTAWCLWNVTVLVTVTLSLARFLFS